MASYFISFLGFFSFLFPTPVSEKKSQESMWHARTLETLPNSVLLEISQVKLFVLSHIHPLGPVVSFVHITNFAISYSPSEHYVFFFPCQM